MKCTKCHHEYAGTERYCPQCGVKILFAGERRHVTILFSDLSGYTAMSEKLDPEDVKEILRGIIENITEVITQYEGHIVRFIGDQVMAVFGAPKAHEDDSVRAIRAALETHELVKALSPRYEDTLGQPLTMHSGIETGLIVIGSLDSEKETDVMTGETINIASRLCDLANADEILIGTHTFYQTEGLFNYRRLNPTGVNGTLESVDVYQLLSMKEVPVTTHRLSGFRADLIGRKVEMAQLDESLRQLCAGKGTICTICGDAGTGKSRLIAEFKAMLDPDEIQWREGHAYEYSHNISYFPLIDLMNRTWQIEEGDAPETIRGKVESAVERMVGEKKDIVPYIGSLYALSYPELEGIGPDYWRTHLFEAVHVIFEALTRRAPTVVFLEDLHWADPSSIELFRYVISKSRYPALFLCAYRPPFTVFTHHQLKDIGKQYQDIRLQDLSPSEMYDMLESLLKTRSIPAELRRFFQDKTEGSPFYVEELINSLVETGALIRDNGDWTLTRPISEADIPTTVQGVISARVDRLETETKRILQEASVIGRAFLYDILMKITELKDHLEETLKGLEQLDLIRERAPLPDLEYIFKHALTQEVVYNGLLKKERQEIHEHIGLVMEQLFHDRLQGFYETLAFHFKQGRSVNKAVDYLAKSGEKSLDRFSLDESHRYYKEAFDLLKNNYIKSREDDERLIDLIIQWAFVFFFRGDWIGLEELFASHEEMALSLNDKARLGMFYTWLGVAQVYRGRPKVAHPHLSKALKLGEEVGDQRVIGHASGWLAFVSADLGLLDEALSIAERAREISEILKHDKYLFYWPLMTLGLAYWLKGESSKNLEIGQTLLELGKRHSNIRCLVTGHWFMGCGYLTAGDYPKAIEWYRRAVEVSADPLHMATAKGWLSNAYFLNGQFEEAEKYAQENMPYMEQYGYEYARTPVCVGLGVITINKGRMSEGLKMIEDEIQSALEHGRMFMYAYFEYVLGQVYFEIALGGGPKRFSVLIKNIGFLVKNVPFASKKAEDHFSKAIKTLREIGAKGLLGRVSLSLGLLHKTKGRVELARNCIKEAIQVLEQCEAHVFLKQAREVLESLE